MEIWADSSEKIEQVNSGKWLPLMEAFYTIQGEGAFTGTPSYFVRIGGCDVGCHWCDVKESWNAKLHPVTPTENIAQMAAEKAKMVVVTGGEPLTWNMLPLTQALKNSGLSIHLETSGAYPLSGVWDWICLSPKKTAKPQADIYPLVNELKVIVYNHDDFKWAEMHADKVGPDCKLYLQPEWSRREKMIPLITDYVMNHPKWRISLQTHKYLGIP